MADSWYQSIRKTQGKLDDMDRAGLLKDNLKDRMMAVIQDIKTDLEKILKRSVSKEVFAKIKVELDTVTNAVTAVLTPINDKTDVASLANMLTTYVLVIGFFWDDWITSGN